MHPRTRLAVRLAALPVFAASAVAFASDKPKNSLSEAITPDEVLADVAWLSDDAREGRGLMTQGLDDAADYIAERFEELGLEPMTGPGFAGYFHTFEMPFGSTLDRENTTLQLGGQDLSLDEDFIPFDWSKPAEFEGELAFAGYGVANEEKEYDDYAGVDVEGKVVLVLRYEPRDEDGKSQFTGRERVSRAAGLTNKARAAQQAGAIALLVVNPPLHNGDAPEELATFGLSRTNTEIPAFHVSQAAANRMLEAADMGTLEELQEQIDANLKPVSVVAEGVTVAGQFEATSGTKVKNVVAMLPGKNRDEYVVVGGHYDHVGSGEYGSSQPGDIHNGADDNASGTAAILEIAETLALEAKDGRQPDRSVIFALFTAEELGLIGSRELVAQFPVPVENVVGMLNLDMVGRVRDDTIFVGGSGTSPAFVPMVDAAIEDSPLERSYMGGEFDSRSDHANFIRQGVPALFLFSGLHPEYHGPDDDVELVNAEGLAQTATLGVDLLHRMASASREEIAFVQPQRGGSNANRVRLGVMPGEAVEVGGVTMESVGDNTPAARAGLQAGDVVLAIGTAPVEDMQSLRAALGQLSPGDETTLVVRRDDEMLVLDVEF